MAKGVADNVIRIPCKVNSNFFMHWFQFLTPFHHLTDREMEVAASLVKHRYELSKAVTKWFLIILSVACASGIINEVIVKNLFWITVPQWIECLFLCLSIFLPFTPCLFCSVYAIYETSRVNKKIEILVNSLQDEQNALHNRKIEIDINITLYSTGSLLH